MVGRRSFSTPPKPAPYMHMQRIDNVVYGDGNNAPNTPGRPDQTRPDPTRPLPACAMRMSDTLRRAHYLPVPIRLHTRPSRPSDPASPCALSRSGESPRPPPHRETLRGAAAPVFQRPFSTAGSRAGWRGALGCPGEAVCPCALHARR
jgi:hypothetical protein